MKLTNWQVSALKKLMGGELPLAQFCDSIEGEKLCWSGLVGIQTPTRGIRSTVALSDRGRAALANYLG